MGFNSFQSYGCQISNFIFSITFLTPSQISALTVTQVSAITIYQLPQLLSSQISRLTGTQISGLSTPQLNSFTVSQMQILLPILSTSQIVVLSPIQIGGLSNSQISTIISYLTPTQIPALTPNQIGALTNSQISTVLPSLTQTQIYGLTQTQISSLSTSQISSLSSTQISGLRTDFMIQSQIQKIDSLTNFFNLDFFTTSQIFAINNTQVNNYMGDVTFYNATLYFLENLNPNVIRDIINSGADGFCRFNPIAYTPAQFIQLNSVRPTRNPYYSNFDYVLSYRNNTQEQINALTPQLKSQLTQSQIDSIKNQGLTYTP